MKKVKFYYNPKSLKYEHYEEPLKFKLLKIVGFLCTSLVFAGIFIILGFKYFDSPKEKVLKQEISALKLNYNILNKRLDKLLVVMNDIEKKDDNIYRVIFEAEPLDKSIRNASYGGVDFYKELENYSNSELLVSTAKKIDLLRNKLAVESKSYDELYQLIKRKSNMLASIPAVQPIDNKDLTRIASGFGMRIHPIYKVPKMHAGLDFTAPIGTSIFATGDGKVESINEAGRGYGNNVIINHGYGYKTLYAHMSKILVHPGQKISRGEKIGFVGSTGLSSGPHLHYEVIKDNSKIDPLNYFYNDLTPEEYEKMLNLSNTHNQSFD